MNSSMKFDKYFYIPVSLFLFTAILFVIQKFIIGYLAGIYDFQYSVLKIYSFHFLVTLTILSVLFLISKTAPKYIGYTFMGFILFKMAASVIFLIPLIKLEGASKIPDFTSFFIPYFFYLFFEIVVTLKLLKQSEA